MIIQTAAVLFLLFIIPFNVHGQSSPDNGQIVVNNKDLSGGLMSTVRGAAAAEIILNTAAPKPKDRIGSRRRKRQQPSKFIFIDYSLIENESIFYRFGSSTKDSSHRSRVSGKSW